MTWNSELAFRLILTIEIKLIVTGTVGGMW